MMVRNNQRKIMLESNQIITAKKNNNMMMFNPPAVPLQQRRVYPRPTRPLYIIIFGCAYMAALLLLALVVLPNPRELLGGRDLLSSSSSSSSSSTMTMNFRSASRLQFDNPLFIKQNKSSTKPTLLLHLGPPKTSSTYLQCILTNMIDTLALDNYVFLGLQVDKCKKKTPSHHPALLGEHCYDIFVRRKMAEFSPKFLNELRTTHSQGKSAIIMNECFKFFTPEQRKLFIDEISSNWNVKLIMNYRRAFEIVPSFYNEQYKPKTLQMNPSLTQWPGERNENNVVGRPLLPFDIEDRGHYTRIFQTLENKGLHPVEETRQQYGEAFPDLTIIKLHELDRRSKSGDAVLQEMFCHIAVDSSMPHSCAAVHLDETVKIGDLERNPYYSFNYDNLATAAYEKQLFGFQNKKKATTRTQDHLLLPSRRDVAELLQRYQEDNLNLTHHDFDTGCLAKKKMDRLLNVSIASEKVLYESNWTIQDEVNHRQAFLAYQEERPYTFCWINTEKTLQDPTWLAFFDSIV